MNISMLSPDLCAALEHLQGCKIALFGDHLQLPPVVNAWRGQPCKRFHESPLLGMWANWNRVELKTYYRSPDRTFADWFIQARQLPLELSIPDALAQIPEERRDPRLGLCVSNRKRMGINLARQAGAVGVPMTIEGHVVQLSPGISSDRGFDHEKIYNGSIEQYVTERVH
jgi:hypothetical protein